MRFKGDTECQVLRKMSDTQSLLSECHPCPGRLARSLTRSLLSAWLGGASELGLYPVHLGARPRIRLLWAEADFGKSPALGSLCHVCTLKGIFPPPKTKQGPPWPFDLSWLLCLGPDSCPPLTLPSSLFHLLSPSMLLGCDIWDKEIS